MTIIINLYKSSVTMWKEGWFFFSNAKHIGTLYLIFALFSGLLGTAFSVLIRLELSGPGVQFIADNQLYNSIITAHVLCLILITIITLLLILCSFREELEYTFLLSTYYSKYWVLGIYIYVNIIFLFTDCSLFFIEIYKNGLFSWFIDWIIEPMHMNSDSPNEGSSGGTGGENAKDKESSGGTGGENNGEGPSGETDGMKANREWEERANYCEHRSRDLKILTGEEEHIENPIPCDFGKDTGEDGHNALQGPGEEAILCQNCHAVICSDCFAPNSDSDKDSGIGED